MSDERTLADLAQETIAVQDACNLSGVVLSWGLVIKRLRQLLPLLGTRALNEHPINVCWASKVHSLTGDIGTHCLFGESWDAVRRMAKEESK